ncbi:hypothetical protein [Streptomyces sp. NPDC097640]|uniref:hypothetical protein n=1 Tax=Streptomyces sp. NPDC097640 TaxID=3157229 RepID=UPI0033341E43
MSSQPRVKPATETTAVLNVLNQSEGAYGARFDEDAYNYPSPSASQAWPGDEPPPEPADAAEIDEPDAARHARDRSHEREAGGWQQLLARRRPVLAVAAALMVAGGFGLALSAVSDTVSSDPTPAGTARVPEPKSPTEQPPLPGATASATSPPGGGASSLPATGDRHDDEEDEEHEEDEDGDRSGDD